MTVEIFFALTGIIINSLLSISRKVRSISKHGVREMQETQRLLSRLVVWWCLYCIICTEILFLYLVVLYTRTGKYTQIIIILR